MTVGAWIVAALVFSTITFWAHQHGWRGGREYQASLMRDKRYGR